MSCKKLEDITGQRFGKIIVLGYSHQKHNYDYYYCRCVCDIGKGRINVFTIKGIELRQGRIKSCGRCNLTDKLLKQLPQPGIEFKNFISLLKLGYSTQVTKAFGQGIDVIAEKNGVSTKHGKWEIAKEENNTLECRTMNTAATSRKDDEVDDIGIDNENEQNYVFPSECQLRDFIARNISIINPGLRLYTNDNGIDGVEFRTDVGNIDILAEDKEGNLVVFELKLSKSPDMTLGQIQRYMGWVKKHLAKDKQVRGIIIAKSIDDKLKYAVSVAKDIQLFEYEINFDIKQAKIDD